MNVSSPNSVSYSSNQMLFDPATGMASKRFLNQLQLVGLISEQFFPNYDSNHVYNINQLLCDKECYQKDYNFYKNAGISKFNPTFAQSQAFIEDAFQHLETIMPRDKQLADAVFVTAVPATMRYQFDALKESIEKGCSYETIHFIIKNSEEKKQLRLLRTEYQNILSNIDINYVKIETNENALEFGLKALLNAKSLKNPYVIITHSTFAAKAEKIAISTLNSHTCIGIASVPEKDWKKDMENYGYNDPLKTFEENLIARVSSLWNFIARQVDFEMKNFQKQYAFSCTKLS